MSMAARELKRARLRDEHPEWSEARIKREILRLAFHPQPLPAGFLMGLPEDPTEG